MRTNSLFLLMSVAGMLIVAMSLSAAGASASSVTLVLQKTEVFKPDDGIFTGIVITNDLKARTITINGHNPLRRETSEIFVIHGTSIKEGKKPQVKDAAQVFQVDPFCHVALTNRPTAQVADIQCGDVVDVDFRKMASGVMIASVIRTAGKHPYDPPPDKTTPKKKT